MAVESPEDLYGLPLPEFIPERTALVKALRKDKRRDDAAAIAAMRKPSVAAWAVNQLIRTQGATIRKLFKAGDELAEAQSGAAGGTSAADAMRAATGRQREAIGELVEAARGLLSSDGHPLAPATLERVTETLRAASIDRASREQLEGGCLERELEFAGLGIGELSATAPERSPKRATKPKAAKERADSEHDKAEREREAEAARERKAALTAARKTDAEARRFATRAENELSAAQTAQQDAAVALEEADERLAQASERAETTAGELKDAERALSKLDKA